LKKRQGEERVHGGVEQVLPEHEKGGKILEKIKSMREGNGGDGIQEV
jgi:hypothetical protein